MTRARLRLVAAVVGALLGAAGRNLPAALAARVVRSPRLPGCGMEEVLECVVRDSGTVLVAAARLALVAVVISAIAALVGTAAAVVGLTLRHRIASNLLVGGGVMLVVPAIWLVGSFIVLIAA